VVQVVSNVTGYTQLVPEQTVGAAYGDGLLAAIGVGLVPLDTDWTRPARIVSPAEEARAAHEALYPRYSELYLATAEIIHGLQEHKR
jgi:xylulokinase